MKNAVKIRGDVVKSTRSVLGRVNPLSDLPLFEEKNLAWRISERHIIDHFKVVVIYLCLYQGNSLQVDKFPTCANTALK